MRWVALMAMAVGCGIPPVDVDQSKVIAAPPGADEAIRMLNDRYGIDGPGLPVYWYGGAALDCWGGLGYTRDGHCELGARGSNAIIVAWPGSDVPISSTPLAHEKAHERWDDPGHNDAAVWGPIEDDDYEPGSAVGDANAALVAIGL